MLTREENDLITQTGPGTPGGDFLRRYWQPSALSEELPPGGPPKPVRLLGEDLAMFRDDAGRIGLLGLHCAHRAADLSYGRIEDGGLRCLYHGWLYDVGGNCLEQPGEPEHSTFKDKVHHLAYPCLEKGGIIFAYLGPGEPPLLPAYEFLNVPDEHRTVTKYYMECNYHQGNEGNIDPQHVSFLHRHVIGRDRSTGGLPPHAAAPEIEVEETDFGLRLTNWHDTVPGDGAEKRYLLRVSNFILPNLSAFPGGVQAGQGHGVNWHVPIDDTHHWKYVIAFNRVRPMDFEQVRRDHEREVTSDYRLIRNPCQPLPAGPRGDAGPQLHWVGRVLPVARRIRNSERRLHPGQDDRAPRLHRQGDRGGAPPDAPRHSRHTGGGRPAARAPRLSRERPVARRRRAGNRDAPRRLADALGAGGGCRLRRSALGNL